MDKENREVKAWDLQGLGEGFFSQKGDFLQKLNTFVPAFNRAASITNW
jgi:hypothetical protein